VILSLCNDDLLSNAPRMREVSLTKTCHLDRAVGLSLQCLGQLVTGERPPVRQKNRQHTCDEKETPTSYCDDGMDASFPAGWCDSDGLGRLHCHVLQTPSSINGWIGLRYSRNEDRDSGMGLKRGGLPAMTIPPDGSECGTNVEFPW
jgi:hypothetical protein